MYKNKRFFAGISCVISSDGRIDSQSDIIDQWMEQWMERLKRMEWSWIKQFERMERFGME